MTTIEVLQAARELIATEDKWCQGRSRSGGRICALEAIRMAALSTLSAKVAERAIEEHIPLPYLDILPAFNDTPGRTHAEVLALFDAAIAAES